MRLEGRNLFKWTHRIPLETRSRFWDFLIPPGTHRIPEETRNTRSDFVFHQEPIYFYCILKSYKIVAIKYPFDQVSIRSSGPFDQVSIRPSGPFDQVSIRPSGPFDQVSIRPSGIRPSVQIPDGTGEYFDSWSPSTKWVQ